MSHTKGDIMTTQIQLGDEREYPQSASRLEEGEISLIGELLDHQGEILYRCRIAILSAPLALPVISKSSRIRLKIKAVQDSVIKSADKSEAVTATQELIHYIQFNLLDQVSVQGLEDQKDNGETGAEAINAADLIERYLDSELELHQKVGQSRPQLNNSSQLKLFYDFERAGTGIASGLDFNLPSSSSSTLRREPFSAGLSWLMDRDISELSHIHEGVTKPKDYVAEILRQANLIGREILLESDSLKYNCGSFIAFKENTNGALFFKPVAQGYQLWDPSSSIPPRLIQSDVISALSEEEGAIDPRVLSIQEALSESDTTKRGLVSFAYGKSGNNGYWLPIGIICGFAIGFLLSIGKEVGASRWIFGMTILGSLLGGTLTVLSPGFRMAVMASLLTTGVGLLTPTFNTILTNSALPDRDLGLMLQMGGILLAAALLSVSLNWIRSSTLIATQQAGNTKLLLASLYRTLQLPTGFYNSFSIGDLSLRFSAISELQHEVKQLIEGGFIKAVLTTIYILFMLRISVKLTILSILLSIVLLIPTAYLGYRSRSLERKSQQAEGEASGRNLELISSVSKLRMSGAEVPAARYWGEAYKKSIAYSFSLDVQSSISKMLQSIIPNLGTLLLFIMVTQLSAESLAMPSLKAPNPGELLGFFSAFATFIGSMASLSDLIIGAFDIPILWERAEPLLHAPIEILPDASEPGELKGQIILDRVSYRYAPELNLTLDRVSFEAKQGEFIALVGPSGSGKSTVVRMLLGFGFPEEGTVFYDGKPLNSLKLDQVRRQIGTVMQNSGIFAGSIFEVIAGSAAITIDQAWEAAEMVGLASDIHDMPMGMQTVVPEGGGTLSGGQRQRLAIARALVRKPKLLIFDEATSALDNRTQAVVTQSLENLKVTRIVIAHRLSTIKNADKIVVIQQGQVVETGAYNTLMDAGGLFYQLMNRQIL